jgi:hypothetical protein
MVPLVMLALESAMRRGELLSLRWENINLGAQTAFLPLTKNGTARLEKSVKLFRIQHVCPLMTAETKKDPSAFVAIVEQTGKFITVAVAVLLALSVCYDYSFLSALGLSFNDVPSSTAEHVRSALLWVPYIALTVLGAACYELFMRRMEGGLSEREILARVGQKVRKFRQSSDKMLSVLFGMIALTSPILGTDASWVYLFFMFGWGSLAVAVIGHDRMGERFSRIGAVAFIALPLLFSYIGLLGYHAGARFTETSTPAWQVVIRVGNTQMSQTLIGMRRFSTFAITVDQGRSVAIIPNDSILSARKVGELPAPEMNMCRWFGMKCIAPVSGAKSHVAK